MTRLLTIVAFGCAPRCALPPRWTRTKRPDAGPAPAAAFPECSEHTLSNGLKVFIVESKRQPTVTLRLLLKDGGNFDGEKTGLVDFVAALLDRGTPTAAAQQFAQEVDFYGARFGAGADNDSVSVSISGLVKFLPKMLDLFSDAIFHPLFPADELAKEAKKVKSALAREKQQPSALAPKLRDKLVFGDHPYGDFATEMTVDSITRDDLAQFHAHISSRIAATLAVVGDVKSGGDSAAARKGVRRWKTGPVPR